ncbi:MAG TPA: hypothetical protein VHV30_09355 [Polyangiaceae bacterium]|jgi:hypothetical protein|nr:hypothetical protein [Polyangiaceae bacterium]
MTTRTKLTGLGFGHGCYALCSQLLLAAAAAGAVGCATSGAAIDGGVPGVAMAQGTRGMGDAAAGLRVGATQVIDGHVNPMVPVRLTVEGGEVAVRFGRPRERGALAHLNPTSLAPVSPETAAPAERAAMPSSGAVRAVLADGRFIECWKSGDAERGYRLMAQAWTGSGSPLGRPVAISSSDVDVLGAPQVAALEGERAVATYSVMDGDRAELVAVSLEVL